MDSWKETVILQLKERDAKEKILFEPIITAHWNLWNVLKQRSIISRNVAAGGSDLEKKVQQLESELAICKSVGVESERSRIKLKELQNSLEDKSRSAERSREEATLLRDELFRVRKSLEQAENKNRQLSKENYDLLDRLLKEKLTLADQLNEMTHFNAFLTEKVRTLQASSNSSSSNAPPPIPSVVISPPAVSPPVDQNVGVAAAADSTPLESRRIEPPPSLLMMRFQAHDAEIPAIRYDAQGMHVFTCSCDGTIKAWDAMTGVLHKTLRAPVDVQLMGCDVQQRVVVATGSDRAVRIWSLDTERVQHTLLGHASKVYACRLTSDARTLITGGTDRKLMIWDVVTGNRTRQISCSSICNSVAVDENANYVASAHQDSAVRLWDLRSGKLAMCISDVHSNTVTSVDFAPGVVGSLLSNSRDNTLCLIDLVSGRVTQRFGHMNYRSAYNWSSADVRNSLVGAGGSDGKLYLWRMSSDDNSNRVYESSSCVQILSHGDKRIAAFQFNPLSPGHCAASDENGLVSLWMPKSAVSSSAGE